MAGPGRGLPQCLRRVISAPCLVPYVSALEFSRYTSKVHMFRAEGVTAEGGINEHGYQREIP